MYNINKLIIFFLLVSINVNISNVEAAIVFSKLNSPYLIDNDFIVNVGDTLIIEAGVQVFLNEDVNIMVSGVLLINGAEDDPVFLMPTTDIIGWGLIKINSPGSESRLENVYITDGRIIAFNVNLFMQNVYFINRQDLAWNDAIARIIGGSVVIIGCSITGSGVGEGFLIHDQSDPIILQCNFVNIPDAVEFINVENGIIRHNVFSDIPDDAIDLNNCSGTLIDSNIIVNVHDRGMEIGSEGFGSSENIMVNRNLIIGCDEGVNFKENSFGTLLNNTFYNNNIAVTCIEFNKNNKGSSVEILNSIFSQSVDADFYADDGSSININYSLSDLSLPEGNNNMYDNPLFLNPEEDDFSLMSDSPCINAGDPQSPHDPDNTISDLGAYFYDPSSLFLVANSELVSVNVYPNPFIEQFYVSYHLANENTVGFTIVDLNGTIIKSVIKKSQPCGYHRVLIDNIGVKSGGVIICIVTFGDKSREFVLLNY